MNEPFEDLIEILWYDYEEEIPISHEYIVLERIWAGPKPDAGLIIAINRTRLAEWVVSLYSRRFEFTEREQRAVSAAYKVKHDQDQQPPDAGACH